MELDVCNVTEIQYVSLSAHCIQVEFLLKAAADAYSTELAVVSVQPSPVCGNGLCEVGEQPGGNSTASLRTGAAIQSPCMHFTLVPAAV